MQSAQHHSRLIGITMGDPTGVGPEIIARAWPEIVADDSVRFIVIGQPGYLQRSIGQMKLDANVVPISQIDDVWGLDQNDLLCFPAGSDAQGDDLLPPARVDARAGQAAFDYITAAITLALDNKIEAIVTAPIHKAAMQSAGLDFPGHTEILADRCGVKDFAMMLYIPEGRGIGGQIGLGVVHTTLHQSLRSALDDLSIENILSKCKLAHEFANSRLKFLGLERRPRIAVAAVNPHAGESGLFGREEIEMIQPAVAQANALGIHCNGPLPCDTLMARAASGEFDLVVAMVHDQGHIALKLLGMHNAVNITLGLPIIRTSVAHGTALEIAGTGTADHRSLLLAINEAKKLAAARRACR